MPSLQIAAKPNRRVAARFVRQVRTKLQKLAVESKSNSGVTQSDVARLIGVHRSVIHRELKGQADISLGRAAELAWAFGKEEKFELVDRAKAHNSETKTAEVLAAHSVTLGSKPDSPAFYKTAA